jgi:hypothetical protein
VDQRKLFPSLYRLHREGHLPAGFSIVGVARRPWERVDRDDASRLVGRFWLEREGADPCIGEAERLEHHVLRAHRARHLGQQRGHRAAFGAGEDERPAPGGRELRAGDGQGRVPRRVLEACAGAQLRRARAIRVVQALQPCMPARAQAALAHRVRGIALQLDRAALARLGHQPTADRALATGARVVVRHAGEQVLGRDQVRHELFGRGLGATCRGTRHADADELDEVAAREDHRIRHGPF